MLRFDSAWRGKKRATRKRFGSPAFKKFRRYTTGERLPSTLMAVPVM